MQVQVGTLLSRKFLLNISLVCLSAFASNATAALFYTPKIYGNIGFHFTGTRAGGGSESNAAYTTISANANSFLWRPWFATYDLGATASKLKSYSGASSNSVNLLYTHLNFSLLPKSRFPFRLSASYGNDVDSWGVKSFNWLDVGDKQSLYFNARQSYITRKGDRFDAWYTQRARNYFDAELDDKTVGAKIKTRGKHQNTYANASYQKRQNSLTSLETSNVIGSVTHNYFPSSEYYVKTIVSTTHYEDNSFVDNTSLFDDRATDRNQLSSFMYWRPEYRPYTATAGLRLYRRGTSAVDFADSNQLGLDANVAGNYTINRRLRATFAASAAVLFTKVSDEDRTDSENLSTSLLLNYRSDRKIVKEFIYYWYASGGVGGLVNAQFDETDFSQTLNIGAGHRAHRVWVTGNRSSLRLNLNQSAREFLRYDPLDTGLNVSHSVTVTWNNDLRKGRFYSQLSMLDSHIIDDVNSNSQIVNFQFSRVVPVTRLSQWGAHISVQASRNHSENDVSESFLNEFMSTGSGRLDYQHARLFGIYKLKFRAKLDVATTGILDSEDRRQADAELRLGYNIGKLSTALIGRGVINNTDLSMGVIVMQLNRSF